MADLTEDNQILRQAINEARRHLDSAAASLRKVLDDEVFAEETPVEVDAAMESAADAITVASYSLQQSAGQRSACAIPGGPTRRQGQFLAYILEYMLRNHLGSAPTHAEF